MGGLIKTLRIQGGFEITGGKSPHQTHIKGSEIHDTGEPLYVLNHIEIRQFLSNMKTIYLGTGNIFGGILTPK